MGNDTNVNCVSRPTAPTSAPALLFQKPKVTGGYWCDAPNSTGKQIKLVPYTKLNDPDPKIYLKIDFNDVAVNGSKVYRYKVVIYAHDGGSKSNEGFDPFVCLITESQDWIDITTKTTYWEFEVAGKFFGEGARVPTVGNVQHLYAKIIIEGAVYFGTSWGDQAFYLPDKFEDYLDIHVIRFIPQIMKDPLGWDMGAKFLDYWFQSSDNNQSDMVPPNLTDIDFNWLFSFQRIKDFYETEVEAKLLELIDRSAVHGQIIKEIKKLVDHPNGAFQLPPLPNPSNLGPVIPPSPINLGPVNTIPPVPFGQFNQITDYNNRNYSTEIDRVYVTYVPFKTLLPNSNIDGFTASLGSVVFRLAVRGEIQSIDAQNYQVTINEVGVYGRDSFDFNDGKNFIDKKIDSVLDLIGLPPTQPEKIITSQPLGFWNPETRYGGGNPGLIDHHYVIKNYDFRKWRKAHGAGEDHLIFTSDVKIYDLRNAPYRPIIFQVPANHKFLK